MIQQMTQPMHGNYLRSLKVHEMTVRENKTRIIRLEDDVQDIDNRLSDLEVKHIDLMARLDIILNGVKLIAALVAASLGFDLGLEGGVI